MIPQHDANNPANVYNLEEYTRRRASSGEAAMARIAAVRERMERSAAATKDMAAQLEQLRGRGQDPNGLAEAEVDASGNLTDLVLSDRAQRHPLPYTAQAVLEAVRAARAALTEQTRDVVAGTIGADSESGQAVLEQLDRRLGRAAEGGER